MQDSRPTSASESTRANDEKAAAKDTPTTFGLTIDTSVPTIRIHDPEKTPGGFSLNLPDTQVEPSHTTPTTSPISQTKDKNKSLLQSLFKRQSKAPALPMIQTDTSPLEHPLTKNAPLTSSAAEARMLERVLCLYARRCVHTSTSWRHHLILLSK